MNVSEFTLQPCVTLHLPGNSSGKSDPKRIHEKTPLVMIENDAAEINLALRSTKAIRERLMHISGSANCLDKIVCRTDRHHPHDNITTGNGIDYLVQGSIPSASHKTVTLKSCNAGKLPGMPGVTGCEQR